MQMDVLLLDFFNNSVVTLTKKCMEFFLSKTTLNIFLHRYNFFLTMSKEIYPDLCVCITRII